MFQYFHPTPYDNNLHKFNFIHALKNFTDHNKGLFYKENSGLQNNAYWFQTLWIRIADDKEETKETMLGAVYYSEETQAPNMVSLVFSLSSAILVHHVWNQ